MIINESVDTDDTQKNGEEVDEEIIEDLEADGDTDDDNSDSDDGGDTTGDEDKTDWKAKAEKAEADAKKYKAILDRKTSKKVPSTTPAAGPSPANQTSVADEVQKALDKRDLDALNLSPELKVEVKNYARLHKVSIQAAMNSDYISFMKGKAEQKAKAEEASAGGPRKTQPASSFSEDTSLDDFDLSTEEGRKSFDNYKAWLKSK